MTEPMFAGEQASQTMGGPGWRPKHTDKTEKTLLCENNQVELRAMFQVQSMRKEVTWKIQILSPRAVDKIMDMNTFKEFQL